MPKYLCNKIREKHIETKILKRNQTENEKNKSRKTEVKSSNMTDKQKKAERQAIRHRITKCHKNFKDRGNRRENERR